MGDLGIIDEKGGIGSRGRGKKGVPEKADETEASSSKRKEAPSTGPKAKRAK